MTVGLVTGIHGRALVLLPRRFRKRHGEAMRRMVREMAEAVASRPWRLTALLAGILWDIMRQASREHSREWMRRVAPYRLGRPDRSDGGGE